MESNHHKSVICMPRETACSLLYPYAMHGVDISHLSNVLIAVALRSLYTYPVLP